MTLEQILQEVLFVSPAGITDELALKDIPAWDSMSHITLITRIEEVFSIQLTGDEIADLRTVGDIRRALRGRGKVA